MPEGDLADSSTGLGLPVIAHEYGWVKLDGPRPLARPRPLGRSYLLLPAKGGTGTPSIGFRV